MSGAGHTPGPWAAEGKGIHALVRGADGTIVAVRHRLPSKTHEANSYLIAAAPDLLAALEAMVALWRVNGQPIPDEDMPEDARSALAMARAALATASRTIAEAEGGR